MKAVKASLARALEQPDPAVRFYLFYGPDEAGSRALATQLLIGLGNAEKFVLLSQTVKADPACLADEARAMALFGGKRAIWIEPAGDEIAEGIETLLAIPASESPVIALAGQLRKTSTLVKLAESHAMALAHCSYVPEGRGMEHLVSGLASDVGLKMMPGLAQRIATAASGNQAIAARELEKFAIYLEANPTHPRELDHETVDRLGADSAESDLMRLGDLALAGRMDELLGELARLPHGGFESIPIIRALQRRLLMLAPLRARIEQGEQIDAVMTSISKTLFWKDKSLVQRLLLTWSAKRLAEAAARVSMLEQQIMLLPVANEAALGETLIGIARAASRSR